MGYFKDKFVDALTRSVYTCSECGSRMEFEDEFEDILICPECGHSVDLERYGAENDEDYDELYPTLEDVLGYSDEDEDEVEVYDEVCGELDDYTPPFEF